MFSLKGILFTILVMEKMCPRACSVLKHRTGEILVNKWHLLEY